MRANRLDLFPLRQDIVMFNHASYGLATIDLLVRVHAIQVELDIDPYVKLGEPLQQRLHQVLTEMCTYLGLDPTCTALTTNATSGAAAVQRSLPLGEGDVVIALDCEYPSVLRGWRRRCEEVGAHFKVVPVPLPLLDIEYLLSRMTTAAAGGRVAVLQFSAISSSAALLLPVSRLAAWGHQHGAIVVVDAAHAPGHIDVTSWDGVDVAFGTLHTWFSVPRSVGILWTTHELADRIHPAEVSLTYDAPSFDRRFAWPGTFDPAPRLALPEALDTHIRWIVDGDLDYACGVTNHASDALAVAGAIPTADPHFLAPQLRAFLLPGVPADVLSQRLKDAGIRAWTGEVDQNTSLLRLSTHVYNDHNDVELVAGHVADLLLDREGRV